MSKTYDMDPGMLRHSNLKSGEGLCRSSVSCKHENLFSREIANIQCPDEIFEEHKALQISSNDARADCDPVVHPDIISEKPRQKKEMTFKDMYDQGLDYDDADEDEDSDWEPSLELRLNSEEHRKRWFCTNCTMVNFDDILHCDICGEYKDSAIVKRGFFSSHIAQEPDDIHVKSEVQDGFDGGSCSSKLALNNSTAVGYDERMLLHLETEMKLHPHPERPDRLRAITSSLAFAGIFPGRCIPIPAREITREELETVHSEQHIEEVEHTSCMISSYFTPDTYANEHSACAARLAAGLCADLSSAIMSGHCKNGFALVRPPGHHAGVRQAMGFCLHNNAAVAALAAQRANAKKVLIVDWDVHHGNGTQEIFVGNKSVLYISLHRHENGMFYPGTGAAEEVGTMGAEGYCVNVPWECRGVGDNDYIFAFQHIVLPIALEFVPDLTIISAGFDAARGDPLGCCDVTPAGFAQMTQLLTTLSDGKLLVILEGGYNLRSISSSTTAVIKVLLGERPLYQLDGMIPSKAGLRTVLKVMEIQKKFWPKLESSLTKLQSQWSSLSSHNRIKHPKKRRVHVPVLWKWGRKRLLYDFLCGHHVNRKGRAKKVCNVLRCSSLQ